MEVSVGCYTVRGGDKISGTLPEGTLAIFKRIEDQIERRTEDRKGLRDIIN